MKSLRKSLNGNKEPLRQQISTPLPLPALAKPPSGISPPQKVIRALSAYRSQAPQELSFQKGDFFYVLKDVDNQGAWYEAHNPVSGARGLVPRSMFEEFNKNPTPSVYSSSIDATLNNHNSVAVFALHRSSAKARTNPTVPHHSLLKHRSSMPLFYMILLPSVLMS